MNKLRLIALLAVVCVLGLTAFKEKEPVKGPGGLPAACTLKVGGICEYHNDIHPKPLY